MGRSTCKHTIYNSSLHSRGPYFLGVLGQLLASYVKSAAKCPNSTAHRALKKSPKELGLYTASRQGFLL